MRLEPILYLLITSGIDTHSRRAALQSLTGPGSVVPVVVVVFLLLLIKFIFVLTLLNEMLMLFS